TAKLPPDNVIKQFTQFIHSPESIDLTTLTREALARQRATRIAAYDDMFHEDDGGVWSTAVAPAPALDVPDSVAALGWSQSNQWGRTYEVDIQRGNLVVRLVLNSDGAGPTEQQFRQIAEDYATLLAELEPVP
ncbi:MAG: hypothetical protein KKC89_06010, partial [Gammaproteobacteria bacterium]|nr:hypothetical protein [Gammaproteobacteria bacterium]